MADKKLYYLNELDDYKVASGYPDVRGWKVKDADKRTVGEVDNLIVNKDAKKVVYLDVKADDSLMENADTTFQESATDGVHGFVNKEGENHLIIPIGLAGINEDSKEVYCDNITNETFRTAKRYDRNAGVDPGYELVIYKHYLPDDATDNISTVDDEFYNRRGFRSNYR